MVECDIRQSLDGEIVLSHDNEVTDVDGNRHVISETNCATLSTIDLGGGEGVPSLQSLVESVNGLCGVMADMKCSGGDVERRVVDLLKPLVADRKIVAGANRESRQIIKHLDAELPVSLSLGANDRSKLQTDDLNSYIHSMEADAVTWQYPLLNAKIIRALHAQSKTVYAWTVDDISIMRALKEMDVDAIITNRPDLFMEIFE